MAKEKTYSEKLKDPRWQKRRLDILNRDKFTCTCCGDTTKTLHVHHIIYKKGYEVWEYADHELITFCEDCHSEATRIKSEVKELIDIEFTQPEHLAELHNILTYLIYFNPYDLMMVGKECQKRYNEKVRHFKKSNG